MIASACSHIRTFSSNYSSQCCCIIVLTRSYRGGGGGGYRGGPSGYGGGREGNADRLVDQLQELVGALAYVYIPTDYCTYIHLPQFHCLLITDYCIGLQCSVLAVVQAVPKHPGLLILSVLNSGVNMYMTIKHAYLRIRICDSYSPVLNILLCGTVCKQTDTGSVDRTTADHSLELSLLC